MLLVSKKESRTHDIRSSALRYESLAGFGYQDSVKVREDTHRH
jgi:hypothetical protein